MGRKKTKILSQKHVTRHSEKYFEEIYNDYFDRLFGFALVITQSENLAKDVVSDVFYNLWNAEIDLFSIKEIKSYLFASVKNQAVRSLSDDPLKFQSASDEHAALSIDQVNPEELLVAKELDEFLKTVVDKLPPQCGLVYQMVKEDGKKYEQVATELGISTDTVKYHLKTALKKIKKELESHFDDTKVINWFSVGSLIFFMLLELSLD